MTDGNQTGRFVWRDLMTTDPEKAETFYTSLFGWTVNPMDMGEAGVYRMFRNGDQDFGGIGPVDAAQGVPPHWVSYIATPNVDETTAKAIQLGGSSPMPGMDIPAVGRFSVVIDPQGAAFCPFTDTSGTENPPEGQVPPVGGVSWNELMSKDAQASKSFYSQLYGYTPKEMDMGTGPYTILYRGDTMEAGILQAPEQAAQMPTAWVIYYVVANIDDSLAKLEQLGGQNISRIIEVPTIGRVAMVVDSLGAMFGLHEPAPMPAA
jgi:predicted enzyme related to lactoylglutathione lyase